MNKMWEPEFDDWFEKSTPNGFNQKSFADLKAKLMERIKAKEGSE